MDVPSAKPNRSDNFQVSEIGEYGHASTLQQGFKFAKPQLGGNHPLELEHQNYNKYVDDINFSLLKKTHGIHAPLRLMMERKAASKVDRMPFLPSSHFSLDVLLNKNENIDMEDVFNDWEPESMGHPHAMVEKQLGILQ